LKLFAIVVAALLSATAVARAEDEPLWEAGLGIAGVSVPDYGGSDQRQHRVLPIPYFVYRGRTVQADRDGIHFFGASRLELDFSFDAAPPVSASNNAARDGMPDLLPSVEVGPSVNLVLLADEDKSRVLKLRLAGRASIATNVLRWEWLGLTAAPELAFQAKAPDWKLTASVGPLFSTEGVNDYAYEVSSVHATMERPPYDAQSGYGGLRFLARGGWRTGPIWLGAFARYDNLRGASFVDSPMMRSEHAVTVGTAVAWVFARSKRRAPR
jgi:outer membrane protein